MTSRNIVPRKTNAPKTTKARKRAATTKAPRNTTVHPAENRPAAELPQPTVSAVAHYQMAFCLIGEDRHHCFGLTGKQRLRRQFARAGLQHEITEDALAQHAGPVILARADAVIDQPLIETLLKRPSLLLTTEAADGSVPVAANVRGHDSVRLRNLLTLKTTDIPPLLLPRAPSELNASFWKSLRKRETPYALLLSSDNQAAVERRVFMGTYKGATDIITKHLWPVPAFHVTRFLAPRGVTPNMVTALAAFLTLLACGLFFKGHYAAGLIVAWAMTFLDTVDGKLARTTLTSSTWGDVLDHGIDLVHPPFWYAAWALGLGAWGMAFNPTQFWWVLGLILAGYVLQRLMEGAAIKWLGIEIHIWRQIDTLFRQITARRNPNLVLLTVFTMGGRPDLGLIAVAAWTVICLVLHALQLAQGFAAKPQGEPLQSWMSKPAAAKP